MCAVQVELDRRKKIGLERKAHRGRRRGLGESVQAFDHDDAGGVTNQPTNRPLRPSHAQRKAKAKAKVAQTRGKRESQFSSKQDRCCARNEEFASGKGLGRGGRGRHSINSDFLGVIHRYPGSSPSSNTCNTPLQRPLGYSRLS